MFCTKCGTKLESNYNACPNCGNLLNEGENNVVNNNVVNQPIKKKSKLAVAALVIGIISVILSFILNIFVIPLAIIGLTLGIIGKGKAGIILNSISMIISVIVIICGAVLFSAAGLFDTNPVKGTWNCKPYSSSSSLSNKDYIVTMELNRNSDFLWGKYGDTANNYVKGTYTYEDLEKTNNSGDYKYYKLNLDGEKYVSDGEVQDEDYVAKYEIGINKEKGEAIMINVNNYNMYYCYLEK